jgi:NADPH:quinone reductase
LVYPNPSAQKWFKVSDKSRELKMKAVVMTGTGNADVLVLQDVPAPGKPKGREVLVRLMAAGINPADIKMRKAGTILPGVAPIVLGFDGAGVIEALGPDVQDFKVDQDVYFCAAGLGASPGTYSEYISIDERFIALKPKSLSFIEAAAAPLVCITAWEALYDRAGLTPGQTVLVQAGAGGVGHVAIQLAKLSDATVCTTVGSSKSAEFVRGLGADHIINYNLSDFVEHTLDWTDGLGVDIAFDTVGGDILSKCFRATKVYGNVVGIVESNWATVDWDEARRRNLTVSFTLMLTPMLDNLIEARQHQAVILTACARQFNAGALRIQASQTFPLAQAADAHRQLEKGSGGGKIVLTM